MNFKPELLAKVLAGTKTQTRRIKKPGEELYLLKGCDAVHTPKMHLKWKSGNTYAAAPGRGKHGQGFIMIKHIRYEPVSAITEADARAEGFANRDEFFAAWDSINGKNKRDVWVWVISFELVPQTPALGSDGGEAGSESAG